MQLDLVSMTGRFPYKAFGGEDWVRSRTMEKGLRERFDPDGVVVNLAALETMGNKTEGLRHRVEVGRRGAELFGWDERWW